MGSLPESPCTILGRSLKHLHSTEVKLQSLFDRSAMVEEAANIADLLLYVSEFKGVLQEAANMGVRLKAEWREVGSRIYFGLVQRFESMKDASQLAEARACVAEL